MYKSVTVKPTLLCNYIYYFYVCVYISTWFLCATYVQVLLKDKGFQTPLELELEAILSCLIRVLGTEVNPIQEQHAVLTAKHLSSLCV